MKAQPVPQADPDVDDFLERVSALFDGESAQGSSAGEVRAVLGESGGREAWMHYSLIGDALRSADLARRPDDAFVLGLRARLAQEPVVLAPVPVPAAVPHGARRWQTPVAVAAGVTMVLGSIWVLAPRPSAQGTGQAVMASASAVPAPSVAVNAVTLRDAELDRYLSAHTQFSGAGALGAPSGFLRASTLDSQPGR